MSGKRRSQGRDDHGIEDVADDVHGALSSLGWVVPLSEAEVAHAERELAAQPVGLPEVLVDAKAASQHADRECHTVPVSLPYSGSTYIDASLARAAREGGEITHEVEEAMRCDRQAAQREVDEHHENARQ